MELEGIPQTILLKLERKQPEEQVENLDSYQEE